MVTNQIESAELEPAWLDRDPSARWRSGPGHGPSDGARDSGSSLIEIDPSCRLPWHVDSAEETIVVISGSASVAIGDQHEELDAGGIALVPADVPHEVANNGDGPLRFVAVYADTDVVTTYAREVQPDGERERRPVE